MSSTPNSLERCQVKDCFHEYKYHTSTKTCMLCSCKTFTSITDTWKDSGVSLSTEPLDVD